MTNGEILRFYPVKMRSRRGAASVLIILLIVLLVFFGVLAMVSSAADLRLAQKRADWNQQYYLADIQAEKAMARIEHALLRAHDEQLSLDQLEVSIGQTMAQIDGLENFLISRDGARLVVDALVYNPELSGQGIEIGLMIDPAGAAGEKINISKWLQWQPPFPEDDTAPGLWEGD